MSACSAPVNVNPMGLPSSSGNIFRRSIFLPVVLAASRRPLARFSKTSSGFSILVRSSACCPSTTRTTKRCIAAFNTGVAAKLCAVLTDLANTLRDEGALDESERFFDATFASAKGGDNEIGPEKRGKGMNIIAIVGCHELPLAVSTHAANHHEVTLVQLSFDFYMIEAKPENLIRDRAYDSDKLDEGLCQEGIEMTSPHKRNRVKPRTQDSRRLRRYERRWLVERFFAWIQWQRRLLVRWEYYAENFHGFVQLASIAILL